MLRPTSFVLPTATFCAPLLLKKSRLGRRVDQDILGRISRFAKRKTLHYGMWLVIFLKTIRMKFFMIQVMGSVSCNFGPAEKN
jgi:hypothetical protein